MKEWCGYLTTGRERKGRSGRTGRKGEEGRMTQAWPSGKKGIRGKGRVSEGDFKWKMRGSIFF